MSIVDTLAKMNQDQVNHYASQGLIGRQELVEWCLIANPNRSTIEYSVREYLTERSGIEFKRYEVVSNIKKLNDK